MSALRSRPNDSAAMPAVLTAPTPVPWSSSGIVSNPPVGRVVLVVRFVPHILGARLGHDPGGHQGLDDRVAQAVNPTLP